ncbi:hypothetical protein [Pseudovibrio sp. Tun.PSC04-5.I4]|uniref:beta strand repeat-containing protein n=1 Tax=Pseudovibrio sp. Tun.PSC04-5.I4 TaxID=1798213 RepID=UPI00135642E4|nr:hypothetical protein [Pseudovibrio sp. Tun.PSC04-5.I4]
MNVTGSQPPTVSNGIVSFNSGGESVFGDYIEQTFLQTIVSGSIVSISLLLTETGSPSGPEQYFTVELRSPTDTAVDTRDFTVTSPTSVAQSYEVTLTDDINIIRIINTGASDLAPNNDGQVDDVSVTVDAPTVTLSGIPAAVNTDPFTVIVTFSEDVTGFDDLATDLTVANGDLTSISGGPAAYTAEITPDGGGDVSLTVPADAALDGSGLGNTASATSTVPFDDVAPTVTLSGVPANVNSTNPFTVTVTFSKNVTGFDDLVTDLTVTNGDLTGISDGPAAYTAEITPDGSGDLTLTVPADAGQDVAGNGNTASATKTVLFDDGSATSVSVTSGDGQDTEFSTDFTNPLVVTVLSSSGNPVAGVIVTFTAPSSGASLSTTPLMATTNASGVASLDVTANSTVGGYTVNASVVGVATTADFTLTNNAGAAASISVTSGNAQNTVISTAFANPLVVEVRDISNNLVPDVVVTFTAPSTGASLSTTPQMVNTDASGVASLSVTANSTAGQPYTVNASVGGVTATADFSLTNAGAAASISVTSGDAQNTAISTAFSDPLVVEVRDIFNNLVPDVNVTFTAPSTGASLNPATQTVTTNASGETSLSVTANSTAGGPYIVNASVDGGGPSVVFLLTNNAGAAASISVTSGDAQNTVISTDFSDPLVVTVLDSGNNPVPGVDVIFTAPSTGASLNPAVQTVSTDAAGQTSLIVTANSEAGGYTVEASVGVVTATADFSLTNAGAAASISVISGDAQATEISTDFSGPLVVRVVDILNNPVPSVDVTFTAPSTGASLNPATQTVTTNASGETSLSVTANSTAGGPYIVNASVDGGGPSVVFLLTNNVGAVDTVTYISGSPQDAVISTAFSDPLVVEVKDSGGNVLEGVEVTFTAPSSGASLDVSATDTAETDANGVASFDAIANSTAGGPYTVTASVGAVTATGTFSLTNNVGAVDTVTYISGSPQDAVISTAFSDQLVVEVKDSGGNVLEGVEVTFTAPSSGASLDVSATDTAETDANGVASFDAIANSTAGGPYTVTASVGAVTATGTFSLTNNVGAVDTVTYISGSPQDAVISTAFSDQLVVEVKDSGGNVLEGVEVTFTAPSSGASLDVSATDTAETDANGVASFDAIANSTAGGPYTVTASVGAVTATGTFSLTNNVGAVDTVTYISGSPQDAVISTAFSDPLVVEVKDSGGNVLEGVEVTFTAPSSGASLDVSATDTAETDANGVASFDAIANSTAGGPYTVTASVGAVTATGTFSLTNNVGAVDTVTYISGSPQDAVISTAFSDQLVVEVKDSGGNVLEGVEVTFTAPSSGASLDVSATDTAETDANGVASFDAIANSTAGGPYTVTASVGAVTATGTFSLTNNVGAVDTVTYISGSPQDAVISTAFSDPLVVEVKDSGGNVLEGVEVTFTAPSSGASLDVSATDTAETDANGVASFDAIANSTAGGPYTVTASVGAVTATGTFSLTNNVGAVDTVTYISGSPQDAVISTAFSDPLVVEVKDSGGNVLEGVEVTFTAPSSGASLDVSATDTAETDANGVASFDAIANSTAGGPYTVTASVGAVTATGTFSLTNNVGAVDTVTYISGSPQDAVISTAFSDPLVVEVKDSGGNVLEGVEVTFTAPSSGASLDVSATDTAETDANGVASFDAIANSTAGGPYTVTASVGAVTATGTFSLTNNVGAVDTVTYISGSPQDAVISTAFSDPLVVEVKDSGGNVLEGVEVTFTAPSSGASLDVSATDTAETDANGVASFDAIANSTAGGPYTVTASVGAVTATGTFSLTNNVGAVDTVTYISGSPQDAVISTAFSDQLVVEVKDSGGNVLEGVEVTFTAPSSGASLDVSATDTAETDANGVASFDAIANSTAGGPYTVTASVGAVTATGTFSLTNNVGAVDTVTYISGSPQDAVISTAFSDPLVVEVKDSGGNVLEGVEVTFTAPSSGASLDVSATDTAETDANGVASFDAIANSTAGGPYTVTASVGAVTATGTFSLTNNVGAVDTVTYISGSPQDAVISTAFSDQLVVEVKDSGGNVLEGVEVTFTAPSSGASLDVSATDTAETDANGVASFDAIANSTAGGPYTVTASVGAVTATGTFSLTNNVGAVDTVTYISGSPQDAVISTAFSDQLVVEVKDSGGNVLEGVEVTFTAPSSGASLDVSATDTAETDANGVASFDAIANSTAGGPYTVTASVGAVTATGTFSLTNNVGAVDTVTYISGSPQDAVISTAFSDQLVVEVKDSGGNVLEGVEVTFTAPSSGASLDVSATDTAETDANGVASFDAIANSTAGGPYTVTASVGAVTATGTFSLTNNVGAVDTVTYISGSPQDAVISTAFSDQLVVEVKDSGGNVLEGVEVTFTAPSSGASLDVSATDTAETDANGVASFDAIANSTAGGPYTVTASVGAVTATGTFSLTNNVGAVDTVTYISGSPQDAVISTAFSDPLVVEVKDSGGNVLEGVEVTFTAPSSGASLDVSATDTAETDANGVASFDAIANSTAGGPYTVTASVGAVTATGTFSLTNNVGAVDTVTYISGSPQDAVISTAFSDPLVVEVKDSGGNVLEGVEVTFTAPSSGASLDVSATDTAETDANGVASFDAIANSTAGGPYTVTASVGAVTATGTFSLTNNVGAVDTVTYISGSPQDAVISTAFSDPLVVEVKDSGGNVLEGVEVTFTAPSSGASLDVSATDTAETDANGVASFDAIANSTAGGPYTVTASVGAVTATGTFSLTNNVGAVDTVTYISGSPQDAVISTAFSDPLVVEVKDSGGNVLEGVEVTFTAPSSGASLDVSATDTAETDANGVASFDAIANSTAGGPYTVTASVGAVTATGTFSLTNNVGAVDTVTYISGSPQDAVISTAFSDHLLWKSRTAAAMC